MAYIIKDRIHFLYEASKILSSTLDYNITLAIVASLVVTNIADFCLIDITEGEEMKRLAARVADPKKQKLAEKFFNFPPDPRNKQAIYEAAEIGRPIIIKEATEKWLKTVSKIKEEREIVKKLKLKSFIFAPLRSRGKIVGVMTIASSQDGFYYTEEDSYFMEELASRIGIAVDNSKLFSEAQDALRTRDEFLSIASHELKTPLTSILLNLQLLLQKIQSSSDHRVDSSEIIKAIESSERQSYRLSKMINDLLNVSLMSTGKLQLEKEKIELSSIIDDLLLRFEIQFNKAHMKVNYKKNGSVTGLFDKVRLEQVFSNLISNAIKYGDKKPIHITLEKTKNKAIVKIRDKGIGVKKDEQIRIFERFRRAVSDKDIKGLGVGLYISQQIVQAHGGNISVASTPGKGSTFTVELPLS